MAAKLDVTDSERNLLERQRICLKRMHLKDPHVVDFCLFLRRDSLDAASMTSKRTGQKKTSL